MADFISFSQPDIGVAEVDAVRDVLQSGWLTTGPVTAAFERTFASTLGAPYALAVSSCTAGLHLILSALDVAPGDEVITTPMTFCATINAILQAGATPVLADVGEDLNVNPAAVRRAITQKTRVLLPVHMAGLPCDMEAIWQLAEDEGLHVVEDAAHACGTRYRGLSIGAGRSDAVAFSFYATKNVTTGEGGMVTTASAELYDRMRVLCLHGIRRDAWTRYTATGTWYYEVVACGFKYNMSDIMAAIGIEQLRKVEALTERRQQIAEAYTAAFRSMPEVEVPFERPDSRHCWHLYILRLNLEAITIDRATFIEEMRARGIGCSVHFIPIPLHPYYSRTLSLRDPCSRAISEYPRLVSLPIYPRMTDADVARVIEAVQNIVVRFRTKRTVRVGEVVCLEPR